MELFNNLTKWIEDHKIKTVCLIILVFVSPIILIQAAYSFPSFIPSYVSPFSAGDLLGYFGAFIATLGTVTLGLIAVKQSEEITTLNIKANEPYLAYRCDFFDLYFTLLLKNRSDNITRSLNLNKASLFPKQDNAKKIELKFDINHIYQLKENDYHGVNLNCEKENIPSAFILEINVSYQDRLGFYYYKKIIFSYENGEFSNDILIKDEPKKKLLSGGKVLNQRQSDFYND